MVLFQEAERARHEDDNASESEQPDQVLLAPVLPTMSYDSIQSMSQTPLRAAAMPAPHEITSIRRTATIRRGTRMIKLLSARQFAAYLHGRRPSGFCYRESDLAMLRTSTERALLLGDSAPVDGRANSIIFGLRWRAVDPSDYHIPFSYTPADAPGIGATGESMAYRGLTAIAPHDRLGPPVLGTGFAPSQRHLIPEYVTADLADLPMPAGTSLVAFAPDGTEVSLYLYIPEQRAWTRMFGPAHRHLLANLPEVPTEQEYVQIASSQSGGSTLIGQYRGDTYEALADPPHEYRVLAKARAARYPVESVARRTPYTTWRTAVCTVVRIEGDWLRLRVCRPDRDTPTALGAQCIERGIYETWAPASEVNDVYELDVEYDISR